MKTVGESSPQRAGLILDQLLQPPISIGFLSMPAELRDEVYVVLGLGTIIRPVKASYRRLGCCIADHCGSNEHYSGEDFVPKDLLNLASTCKQLCLEIRPLIFARSTLLLTSSQLRMFHTYRFRHQLLDFWPWFHVRKLVLHILPGHFTPSLKRAERQQRNVGEQLRTLGKLDLSKAELVILYPYSLLGEHWYYVDILALLRPLCGAPNIRFETCSKLNDRGEPFTEFHEHGEAFTWEGREMAELKRMFAEMATESAAGKSKCFCYLVSYRKVCRCFGF